MTTPRAKTEELRMCGCGSKVQISSVLATMNHDTGKFETATGNTYEAVCKNAKCGIGLSASSLIEVKRLWNIAMSGGKP